MSVFARAAAFPEPWGKHLLCRRYVAVYFTQVTVSKRDEAERRTNYCWAFGVLSDGQSESLGAWSQDPLGAINWGSALVELKNRGVERIRFAISGDLTNFREDLRARFPGALALPSFARLLDRSVSLVAARHRAPVGQHLRDIVRAESGLAALAVLAEFASSRWGDRYPAIAADWRIALEQGWALWSMTPTRRQQVLFGDARAFATNRLLRRALDRHGGFSDGEAAASFARATLSRALRRLDGSQSVGSAEHNYQHERSSPKIAALGI
ncbi:transposase [Rubrivivax sp. RP6-9]|uniref:transposase n=1 Tax=Rubrivivax sp. RP6-9 TaxID=3415750 RepID=UPI003CC694FF